MLWRFCAFGRYSDILVRILLVLLFEIKRFEDIDERRVSSALSSSHVFTLFVKCTMGRAVPGLRGLGNCVEHCVRGTASYDGTCC